MSDRGPSAPDAETYADLFTMNFRAIRSLFRDVSEDEARRRPDGRGNPMLWMLGHVTSYRAELLALLGEKPRRGDGLKAMFGKDVRSDEAAWLPAADLLAQLAELDDQLSACLRNLGDRAFEKRVDTPTRASVPAVSFLHFHESYHVGQLGYLRTWIGKGPLVPPGPAPRVRDPGKERDRLARRRSSPARGAPEGRPAIPDHGSRAARGRRDGRERALSGRAHRVVPLRPVRGGPRPIPGHGRAAIDGRARPADCFRRGAGRGRPPRSDRVPFPTRGRGAARAGDDRGGPRRARHRTASFSPRPTATRHGSRKSSARSSAEPRSRRCPREAW